MVKNENGYTLSEVMLVIAILGILSSMAGPILRNMTNFWRQTTARNEIQRDVRASLDTVNRLLRQARQGTVQIDQVAGQPPYSRVQFQMISGHNVSFWQNNNELHMRMSSTTATSSILSKNIGYIAFTYPRTDDVSILSVAVTMQAPTYLGQKKALQLSIQKVRIMNP